MNNLAQSTNINEVGVINNTFQNALDTYLKEVEHQSKNTANNYPRWFDDFFRFVFNKEMKFITWEDVANKDYINVNTIKKYRLYLTEERKNSNNTINNKISAIKSLLTELNNCEVVTINLSAFNIKRLKEEKAKTYGTLNEIEIKELFKYCQDEETYGMVKYLLFKTLYVTAYRLEAVRTLKWKNLKQCFDSETGMDIWTIQGKDGSSSKHNFTKAISDEFYNELLQLKGDSNPNDYIFTIVNGIAISDKTMGNTFKEFCNKFNLDKVGRNLAIHSIKHSSASKGYQISNHDIKLTQHQANHLKSQTTMDSYVNSEIPLSRHISYIIDKDIDKTSLDNLDGEKLLNLIKSVNDSIFLELQRQAKIKGYI